MELAIIILILGVHIQHIVMGGALVRIEKKLEKMK